MSRPEFIDNRDGNTLAQALREYLEHLAGTLREPIALDVATGYFNPEGFGILADPLSRTRRVRLLLGAEPTPPPARPLRRLTDPRGERFEAKLMQDALRLNEEGLRRDRDHLAFSSSTDRAVRALLDFLASGRIEVRRYEQRFLHGKAFLFSDAQGVIAGSSNFTAAGLVSNLELNLGHYQPSVVEPVRRWFESLWAEAVPYDLAALYEARYAEYQPYLIFLRVLWERYGDELLKEQTPSGTIPLTGFQADGIERAKRILQQYNGVLICDGVGLGKTFMAGAMLQETLERHRQRALVIAPAALRESTWARFKANYQLGVEIRSYEQVTQGHLDRPANEYSLVIIDEAHAFRRADTQRAQALRDLLRGDPPKQLVLMTATPVNNSLWDLYELLLYFAGHDAVFADLGIPSLKRRFDDAAKKDPFSLKPDVLFDILDATTVRRTRHFVKRYYPNDRIETKAGRVTIQFPRPHVQSRSYDLNRVLPGFFDEVTTILAPDDGEGGLSMARYWPTKYRLGGAADPREAALVGLIRSGLLKRFESSAYAFSRTLEKMVRAHDWFLKALRDGVIPAPEALEQLEETDNDVAWEELLAEGTPLATTDIDVERLAADVRRDRNLLERLRAGAAAVTRQTDPKLGLVMESLVEILKDAEHQGIGAKDIQNRRKVLIFSYFADTVEWITEHLKQELATDRRLAAYRGRLAAVRGTEGYDDVGRREAVYGFAPESAEAPPGYDKDLFDILVTTDILAEGMNLQQCARIINYDLPWNPMRLVQRHGRIDRIGSPHSDVHITCIFPDRQLEQLLALEQRIRRKLAQAAASIGLDQVVIPGFESVERSFADNVAEIRRLRRGDATIFELGGEDVNAHSGEEYRQELRKALERYREAIVDLPWGAGSGLAQGTQRGHFFCVRIDDRRLLRFVPADGSPVVRDALDCLRRITCAEDTPRVVPADLQERAYGAWERARQNIYDEWQKATDPANLQPDIRPLFRAAAAHVRRYPPPTMALTEIDQVVAALEAPWGIRTEKALRAVFTPETADGENSTKAIVDVVRAQGLQPWKAPEPLPPIDLDDIALVVWMAVETSGEAKGSREIP